MKKIERIASGENFTAVNLGPWAELPGYTFVVAPGIEIPGKVFTGEAVGSTGTEVSFQAMPAGSDSGFLHDHGTNEELYVILSGSGEYQVDGKIFPIGEGSLIRVAPRGRRALRNTGAGAMVVMCIQSLAGSLTDLGIADGHILEDTLKW